MPSSGSLRAAVNVQLTVMLRELREMLLSESARNPGPYTFCATAGAASTATSKKGASNFLTLTPSPDRIPGLIHFIHKNCTLILPRCTRASLIDNLAPLGQLRDVEADDIHLQFDSIGMLNHGANDSILNFAVMQIDADFVTDRELALWFLGWHAENVCRVRVVFSSS